jgi:hypothetical protein
VSVRFAWLALLVVVGPGCAETVWLPGLALPWWEIEDTVPGERMADDCEITLHEVLVGIPSGALLGDGAELADLLGGQALQLVGASPATLGEIRLAADTPTAFRFDFGAPGAADDAGPEWGNATTEQRERLEGVLVKFRVTCGDASVTAEISAPATSATCPLADDLEVPNQGSFSSRLELDVAALLGADPDAIEGRPWLDADRNGDGTVSADERLEVVTDAEIATRFGAAPGSQAGRCEVSTQ